MTITEQKEQKEQEVWLTSVDQITNANDASLIRSLLTSDGKGVAFKSFALQELLKREYNRGLIDTLAG